MGNPVKLAFNGMNNRTRPENVPEGKAQNAVNVQFSNTGEILFPRVGKTLDYAGVTSSLYTNADITLFVEGGSLKQLNADNTATVLRSGLGTSRVYYTSVGGTVYFANELVTGKVKDGVASEWGTARPPRQPDCMAIQSGGLLAGNYGVVITWIGSEESGTGMSTGAIVAEGGGIALTNFPTPPSYVNAVAVYVSSVNGDDLYLYGEFAPNTTALNIGKAINVISLETQFAYPPLPQQKIIKHMGRIYYSRGSQVYYTEPHRYGLQRPNNFFTFDSDVKTIISAPPSLYVNTATQLYKITNLDADTKPSSTDPGDGKPPKLDILQKGGAARGSECADPDGVTYYYMSDRGFMAVKAEGAQSLTYDEVAIPFYEEGTSTVTEVDGLKYLTFMGANGVQNPLANSLYSAAELARGSM
tara:strand:+ start:774 stop:2018 length:1245 start_codon:yes stop_codon:yes gene_type:complete